MRAQRTERTKKQDNEGAGERRIGEPGEVENMIMGTW